MSSSDNPTTGTAQIGVTGLAVMGSNLARNFAHHGYTVALHNRSVAKTDALLAEHGSEGNFVRSETIPEFLAALEKPRRVIIMVKAGDPTDAVINELPQLVSHLGVPKWVDDMDQLPSSASKLKSGIGLAPMGALHSQPASTWHMSEQPSPFAWLPSSHCSASFSSLFPHSDGGSSAEQL